MNELSNNLQYCAETLKLKGAIEQSFLTLAQRLCKIKDNELWVGKWGSFNEFLAEAKLTGATASKLMKIHRILIVQYKIPNEHLAHAGWSDLYDVLPLIDSQEKAVEYVAKAGIMRREELRDEVREAVKGACLHSNVMKLAICENCGKKMVDYD